MSFIITYGRSLFSLRLPAEKKGIAIGTRATTIVESFIRAIDLLGATPGDKASKNSECPGSLACGKP